MCAYTSSARKRCTKLFPYCKRAAWFSDKGCVCISSLNFKRHMAKVCVCVCVTVRILRYGRSMLLKLCCELNSLRILLKCRFWRSGVGPENLHFLSFFFSFIFISCRLISLQYCSGFCYTLTWISHGFTCIPHPEPPSHLPLYPIPLGLPSAPGPSTCLTHPTWAGDLFHHR